MRFLIFILAVSLLVPPAPVAACGMDFGEEAGSMSHGTHAGMEMENHDAGAEPMDHGCCADDPFEANCGTAEHCATASPGAAFAGLSPRAAQCWPERLVASRAGSELPPPHDRPPYRPPSV